MIHLSKEEKRELLEDARSLKRREDFKKLKGKKSIFTLEWLEEVIKLVNVKYPRHFIKDDKNVL